MITYRRTDASDPGFKEMIGLLDAGLTITDGNEFGFFAQFNKTDSIRHVIVASDQDVTVCAGALKHYDDRTVEIKRMFVRDSHRRMGIASSVLSALEHWAVELGYSHAILETGSMLTGAIALYKREGFSDIEQYGPYIGVETSVCMKKELKR